jgi:tRNA threonylcarbamoyladenosine biosynthesis protein TsaB
MALLLNIDTATDVCSVCISDESFCIGVRESFQGRTHASELTVFIRELLKEQKLTVEQLDAIAVSMGPGSYTGLRIGVSVAKGLCYAGNKPLIAVPTLQVMSAGAIQLFGKSIENTEKILWCPMIDARRMEVYTALYNTNHEPLGKTEAKIIDDRSFESYLQQHKIYFFGSGAEKCKQKITHENAFFFDDYRHSSQFMTKLSQDAYNGGKFENTAYFEPYYLKGFITTTPKKNILGKK